MRAIIESKSSKKIVTDLRNQGYASANNLLPEDTCMTTGDAFNQYQEHYRKGTGKVT